MLPPSSRPWLGPVAVLAALLGALLGLRYAGADGPGALDTRLRAATDAAGPAGWHLARATDFLGEPLGAAALVAAAVTASLLLRHPRAAVLVVAGTGLTVAATTLLKPLVGRTIHGGFLSYPSGHTGFLTAFALAVALGAAGRFRLGRTAGGCLVLAAALLAGAAMGWAQVVTGAHYPTDALGGWCTALVVVPAAAWLIDRAAAGEAGRPAGTGRRGPA
ncbi:phosphatase PAP2 family protein [Streptomyces omiyaensis]|uniref:Phosphatase PAP2 family protein n=1 Tax=Streptomyces omiyaensis TaxID=68247 RepID=A0ABW7BUI4_9ACTN|nr:phosphatase PAP2 family protein [Streptomyces omiyaensis]GGY51489.1 membrane protein [Streptomyces omiyaensis]